MYPITCFALKLGQWHRFDHNKRRYYIPEVGVGVRVGIGMGVGGGVGFGVEVGVSLELCAGSFVDVPTQNKKYIGQPWLPTKWQTAFKHHTVQSALRMMARIIDSCG